jgi:hypothetical protein
MWSKTFLIALAERVIATFVVTFLAATGLDASVVGETGLEGVKWTAALATAGVAAGLSLVKGVLANVGTKDGPGLTHAEQVSVPPAE